MNVAFHMAAGRLGLDIENMQWMGARREEWLFIGNNLQARVGSAITGGRMIYWVILRKTRIRASTGSQRFRVLNQTKKMRKWPLSVPSSLSFCLTFWYGKHADDNVVKNRRQPGATPGLHDSHYAEQFSIISPWPLEPGEHQASIITDKLSPSPSYYRIV